jgi:Spy/CpxP family protein refolding chaperone
MKRRLLIALPGVAAFAASRAWSQTEEAAPGEQAGSHVSKKALTKHSGSKSAYQVPKNANKQAKYISSLSVLLTLTPAQQQQAAAILSNASSTRASLRASMKAARKALGGSVQSNDTGGMSQASTAIGALMAQYVSNGAAANAALFQILTPDQQTKMSQFMG